MAKKAVLIVLDSVGIGAAPDAAAFGDEGSDTLGHVLQFHDFSLPNLRRMGLFNIQGTSIYDPVPAPAAAYGKGRELSRGKDTTTGHWEMAGVPLERPFPTYPNGFPADVMEAFEAAIGTKTLGNTVASGTQIIEEMGDEHVKTGYPIVYTSADSVFQLAAHEEIIPLERLYEMCQIARKLMMGDHAVGRVIARPFTGTSGHYTRTANRRDFSLNPPKLTVLDELHRAGYVTVGVGKIGDIFNRQGLDEDLHVKGNPACMAACLARLETLEEGFIFVNLVDYDMLYGHRRDPMGYGRALEAFDAWLPYLEKLLGGGLLIVTADHGCDPTFRGTDHTREYTPILAQGGGLMPRSLGVRSSFSDIAATILDYFAVPGTIAGTSFYQK